MHVTKGKTIAQCISDRTDYAINPDKTNGGELISSYACDYRSMDVEFALSKRQYKHITGKEEKNNVIAYQVRQSFKPGEVTPEEANQIGYDFASRFLKGKHAFIVCTHIDKAHIKRFDIKGKEYLRTLGKYYIVDIGLRNYLLGFRNRDSGHAIENVVYFELLRRGYDVAIGKVDNAEVDFIATKADEKLYVQVTESMTSEEVRRRELAPLQKIADNYEKIVLSLDPGLDSSYDGIKSLNLINWLLE